MIWPYQKEVMALSWKGGYDDLQPSHGLSAMMAHQSGIPVETCSWEGTYFCGVSGEIKGLVERMRGGDSIGGISFVAGCGWNQLQPYHQLLAVTGAGSSCFWPRCPSICPMLWGSPIPDTVTDRGVSVPFWQYFYAGLTSHSTYDAFLSGLAQIFLHKEWLWRGIS